ncbi:hypothetical protein THZG08_140005 [Vibrio owensii]|nr:hypothetical protein THZG08_140005 [Vibrio owensii]CAH1552345.1 hypothetical protein THOA03_150005 [Vibrio owensii]
MAPWQSGYAADCKSVDLGSTPGGASKFLKRDVFMASFFIPQISLGKPIIQSHFS